MTESMMQKQTDLPPPPEWVVVGESVLIRPYNTSGVIGFVGPTHFQVIVHQSKTCLQANQFVSCSQESGLALNLMRQQERMTEPSKGFNTS